MPTFLRFLTPLSKLCQGSSSITPSSPLAIAMTGLGGAVAAVNKNQLQGSSPEPWILSHRWVPVAVHSHPSSLRLPPMGKASQDPHSWYSHSSCQVTSSGLTFPWANRLFLPQQGSYFLLYHYLRGGREGGQSGSWEKLENEHHLGRHLLLVTSLHALQARGILHLWLGETGCFCQPGRLRFVCISVSMQGFSLPLFPYQSPDLDLEACWGYTLSFLYRSTTRNWFSVQIPFNGTTCQSHLKQLSRSFDFQSVT